MQRKSFSLLLFIGTTLSMECPAWTCNTTYNQNLDGYCYYYNETYNVIQAGPYCSMDQYNCYLSDFYDDENTTTCQPKDRQLLSTYLEDKYCSDLDFDGQIDCEKYCDEDYSIFDYDYNCDFGEFQDDNQQNAYGIKNYGECVENYECASNVCDCVVSLSNYGSCTTSVYDSITEDFFNFVCDKEDQYHDDTEEREEDFCAYYILIIMGHFINSIEIYDEELTCLQSFTDYEGLIHVEDEIDDDDNSWLAWFIPLLILICCCGILLIFLKHQRKRRREREQYGAVINQQSYNFAQQNQPQTSTYGGFENSPVPITQAYVYNQDSQPFLYPQVGQYTGQQQLVPQYNQQLQYQQIGQYTGQQQLAPQDNQQLQYQQVGQYTGQQQLAPQYQQTGTNYQGDTQLVQQQNQQAHLQQQPQLYPQY